MFSISDHGIYLNGDNLVNHELIVTSNFPLGSAMQCLAIGECCSLSPYLSTDAQLGISPSGTGSWRYPNGSYVRLALAGDSYGISRQPGRVSLHRQNPSTAEGVWRCEVPRVNGAIDTAYVGIYAPGNGKYSLWGHSQLLGRGGGEELLSIAQISIEMAVARDI